MKTTTEIPASRLPETTGGNIKLTTVIRPVDLEVHKLQLRIVGTSRLVVHAWSEKARTMMLDKQKKTASKGKAPKDPMEDFKASLYRLPNNEGFCLPATALKNTAVTAANDVELRKTDMRRAFHVIDDWVKIEAPPISEPHTQEDIDYDADIVFEHAHGASMRKDTVRLNGGTADIRFRAQFPKWAVIFAVEYNARVISADQLVNLYKVAGFGVGLCEHRPEKNGSWGRFNVA